MKLSKANLLFLIPSLTILASADTAAASTQNELSCSIEVLDKLGWEIIADSPSTGFENTGTCDTDRTPVFKYNLATEYDNKLLFRAQDALHSVTSKCLFNRDYHDAIQASVKNLTDNTSFEFLPVGDDPRDPFLPPEGTWDTTSAKGYDIPLNSITDSIQALYKKPFVAECSTAAQIAQLAALSEHYGVTTDAMLNVSEVGIGTWGQYTKVPSIAAKQSLFIDRKARNKDGLSTLAKYGHAAFYGQMGYMRPYKGIRYVDSIDNLGQNYMIVNINDLSVAAIKARKKPLKELSKISIDMWKEYRKRQAEGEPIDLLKKEMQSDLEAADPFFRDIEVYVHPLGIKNFAQHVARQFGYNPRTPYVFEVYEDYQPGYFYNRFIDHHLNTCMGKNT